MNLADELQKLNELRQSGALSEQEFQKAKENLLEQNRPAQPVCGVDSNTWGVIMHLSQFCAYLLPLAGIVVPLILWQVKKNESAIIDRHGKIVMNWVLTELILAFIFVMLIFVVIGIPLLVVLGILGVVFPIIGAIKAANGEVWPYPCSFRFFK